MFLSLFLQKTREKSIPITIDSIISNSKDFDYEVIVVNHNSTDATKSVAESGGARVYDKIGGTIGSARNYGVQQALFDILIFIDADVSLTSDWQREIHQVLDRVRSNNFYLTGSHCIPPNDGSYLEKYWFASFSQEVKTTHLGTGHMIMAKSLFDKLEGFDEALKTGEDYDICQRAISIGATVENSPNLVVVHRDYPKNIADFFRRERWHGKGDVQTLKAFFGSKVAIAALIHVVLHLFFLGVIFSGASYVLLLISFLLLFSMPFLAAHYKFKGLKIGVFFVNTLI
ncbi:MAG: glycosyltransferase, partial [Pseudomonadota bacterium]|nr:glycosyltransferase [Pseudomonadota bacterium]